MFGVDAVAIVVHLTIFRLLGETNLRCNRTIIATKGVYCTSFDPLTFYDDKGILESEKEHEDLP